MGSPVSPARSGSSAHGAIVITTALVIEITAKERRDVSRPISGISRAGTEREIRNIQAVRAHWPGAASDRSEGSELKDR